MPTPPRPEDTYALLSDDPPPGSTRERLIEKAIDLFYSQGFHATGLDQLLGEVGVTKQTFYNHFRSKDDLAVAAVERRDRRELRALFEGIQQRAGRDPKASLLSIFDVVHEWFSDPSYIGCIFIHACAEFPSKHDPVHQAAAGHWTHARSAFLRWSTEAGASDPEALTDELIQLLQGAFTRRLMEGADDAALVAQRSARRAVSEYVGDQSTG